MPQLADNDRMLRRKLITGYDQVWTSKEAGQFLQLHPKTVEKLAREGKLPGKRVGKCWRFVPDLLREWLEQ